MNRGEVYSVKHSTRRDPKRQRAFVVVSRLVVIESKFDTVVCAPVYTIRVHLATQANIGIDEGLKHEIAIHCDELISLPKSVLTDYLGKHSGSKIQEVNAALRVAPDLEEWPEYNSIASEIWREVQAARAGHFLHFKSDSYLRDRNPRSTAGRHITLRSVARLSSIHFPVPQIPYSRISRQEASPRRFN